MHRETIGRPMEILLVEDSFFDARFTIDALETGKVVHRLTLTRNGEEALEFMQRQGRFARAPRPDLVLLDLGLPGIDGHGVLNLVKSDHELKSIPVVVMTASDNIEDRIKTQSVGVDAFITKPVDLKKFLLLVKQLQRHWRDDVVLPTG